MTSFVSVLRAVQFSQTVVAVIARWALICRHVWR